VKFSDEPQVVHALFASVANHLVEEYGGIEKIPRDYTLYAHTVTDALAEHFVSEYSWRPRFNPTETRSKEHSILEISARELAKKYYGKKYPFVQDGSSESIDEVEIRVRETYNERYSPETNKLLEREERMMKRENKTYFPIRSMP